MTPNDIDNLAWPSPAPPSAEVSESIRRACTEQLAPCRVLNLRKRVLVSIGTSTVLFALLLTVGWLRHPPRTAVVEALFGAFLWGLVQAAVLCVGLGRPPGRRCACWIRKATVFIVLSLFVAHLTLTSTSLLPFNEFFTVPRSLRSTVVCGIHSILFGGLAVTALFAIWRRTDPFRPRLTGAMMGLAGGLVGAVALDMTCTCYEAWHLWLGHGISLLLIVVGGWFAGGKWLSP